MREVKVRNLVIGAGRPKICVPLIGGDMTEIREEARRVIGMPADMIEWRADHFRDVDDERALTACLRELREIAGDMPILFTLRSEVEGGAYRGSGERYAELVAAAAGSGCVDLVDVELARGASAFDAADGGCDPERDDVGAFRGELAAELIGAAHGYGVRVVASYHDFDATPAKAELTGRFCSMRSHDADILKIAVMPRDFKDVLTLMEATEEASRICDDTPVVGISMGSIGIISRIAAETFGSSICFAAGAVGSSAPGQITARDVDEMLRIIHEFQ